MQLSVEIRQIIIICIIICIVKTGWLLKVYLRVCMHWHLKYLL